MDISKLPPPSSPEARHIRPEREFNRASNRFTLAEMCYNVQVTAARRSRGEITPTTPKLSTPRANGWKRQFEFLK